jgi:hypothetical protein
MITLRELATTLAALMYWREEISQSGNRTARPYLDSVGMQDVEPLTTDEIKSFSTRLRSFPTKD